MRYAIVDIETTGGIPKRDRVIEIAVVVFEGGQVVQQFESLVDPETPIPGNITDLTGIRNDMVRGAPKFHEIARAVVEITDGCVFVAHNVRFDYGFICEEFNRLGYRYHRKLLSTCQLSRRLMPHLPRHNLDTLIRALGIHLPPDKRHRAMGDVLATVQIFQTLQQIDTDGAEFESQLNQGVVASKLPAGISIELLHGLPETPGVYYLHGEGGHVVYVGKSTNIKKRLMQHFADRTKKGTTLQQSVRDITYAETGSELIALLLEIQEIKKLQPLYNRALSKKKHPYGIFFAENSSGHLALLADAVEKHEKRSAVRLFQIFEEAKLSLATAMEKHRLCGKLVHLDSRQKPCHLRPIGRCEGACEGAETADDYNVRVREAIQSIARDFAEDFLLVDSGRSHEEKSFVLVENGRFQGHGYFDSSDSPTLDDLRAALELGAHHAEMSYMVLGYLSKNNRVRKIPLPKG